MAAAKDGAVLPAFFSVSQRRGTEGAEYVLTLEPGTGDEQVVSVFDGDDDYWTLANLIDRAFGDKEKA